MARSHVVKIKIEATIVIDRDDLSTIAKAHAALDAAKAPLVEAGAEIGVASGKLASIEK